MYVQTSDGKHEKRLVCVYCKKTYQKLARHLEYVHKDEIEVKRLHGLPKGNFLCFDFIDKRFSYLIALFCNTSPIETYFLYLREDICQQIKESKKFFH